MRVSKLYGIDRPEVHVFDWGTRQRPEINIPSTRAVGIEVEVENANARGRLYSNVWTNHADGSLRNNGTEYVSRPIAANVASYALQELLTEVLDQEQCCFSPRTSIHIHVDVSGEEDVTVMNAILLYTLFEKMLFRFTGRGRMKNIYCVPVIDTSLLNGAANRNAGIDTRHAHGKWSKYSAMNILPLSSYGTLEFRHMHGTFDLNKVSVWIRMLTNMVDYAVRQNPKALGDVFQQMDENFNYVQLLGEVFQGDVDYLKYQGYDDVEQGVGCILSAFNDGQTVRDLLVNRDSKAPFYLAGK